MDEFWVSMASQVPLVLLFAFGVWKAAVFIRDFVRELLDAHRTERETRDVEWRSWLSTQHAEMKGFIGEQRSGYLASLERLTEVVTDHDVTTKEQARAILEILRERRGRSSGGDSAGKR
jgi:hypothetical protein